MDIIYLNRRMLLFGFFFFNLFRFQEAIPWSLRRAVLQEELKTGQEGGGEETEEQFRPLPNCKKQRGSAGTDVLACHDQ